MNDWEKLVSASGIIGLVLVIYLVIWFPLGVAFDRDNVAAILCPSVMTAIFVSFLYGTRHAKKSFERAQKVQIHDILHMRKASSRPQLIISAFCSSQWFWKRTANALIRLRWCVGWSGPPHMPEDIFSHGVAPTKVILSYKQQFHRHDWGRGFTALLKRGRMAI